MVVHMMIDHNECAPACNGQGCGNCTTPTRCEACTGDIDDAAQIVAGTYVHASCALFWEGMMLLGEPCADARMEVAL